MIGSRLLGADGSGLQPEPSIYAPQDIEVVKHARQKEWAFAECVLQSQRMRTPGGFTRDSISSHQIVRHAEERSVHDQGPSSTANLARWDVQGLDESLIDS